jgi:hypothetical protein
VKPTASGVIQNDSDIIHKTPINCHKQWNPFSMWKTYLDPNTYETPVTKI